MLDDIALRSMMKWYNDPTLGLKSQLVIGIIGSMYHFAIVNERLLSSPSLPSDRIPRTSLDNQCTRTIYSLFTNTN